MSAWEPVIRRRLGGVAGQVMYTYRDQNDHPVTFVGSVYGSPGPVYLILNWSQVRVVRPERYGPVFGRAWVQAFALEGARAEKQKGDVR